MKANRWILSGAAACLILSLGAYFWAMSLMDSLYAYRSPLQQKPPSPGKAPLPSGTLTRRVVVVLVDGLREDTALQPEVMPFLNELRSQGAWARMHSRPPSYSEPGYTVLFTGAWPEMNDGPAINLEFEDIPTWTQDNLFTAARRAGLQTAVSAYYWFEKLIPQQAVDLSFYTEGEDRVADRAVVDAALPWLQDSNAELILIHLDQVDYAGHHEGGARDANWLAAARRSDDLLREISARLDLSRDTLLVCSDHGHIDAGGHGGQDAITLLEPFVLVGAGVQPGHYEDINMADVAPALAVLLGTNLPAASQGRPLTGMLQLTPEQRSSVQIALIAQQEQLLGTYLVASGISFPETKDSDAVRLIADSGYAGKNEDSVASHQAAIELARSERLNRERLPRALLALAAALLPLLFIFVTWRRESAWLLGGAILFVLMFHFLYAIVGGHTYSLSWVTSAGDLILSVGSMAFLALFMSWLLVSLGLGAFQAGPRDAASVALWLALFSIYLLSLPVLLSFTINGMLVGWTLPEFGSMFLAFLSLIQILFVGVLGLLFSGAGALVGVVRGR
jgi:hypothetical protein